MSMQTMNLMRIVSATVSKQERHDSQDGERIFWTQDYSFTNEDGHTFILTTFSDKPGVLNLADE